MRGEALRRLGHELVEVDSSYTPKALTGLAFRVCRRLNHAIDLTSANWQLLQSVLTHQPKVVWIDKGLCIKPGTIRRLRAIRPEVQIVHYSPDDMTGGRHNQSRHYLQSIPLYDMHVTTKSFNVQELYSLGAKAVLFLNNAYSSVTHRPIEVSPDDRRKLGGDVGFIGAFEKDRAESLLFLAGQGVSLRVWGWGKGWEHWAKRNPNSNLRVESRAVWGDEYARALCSFKINLGFLRKANRDVQTTRSIEIPACAQFMLAERTDEHLELFKEGVEAEFFGDNNELLSKCKYYLSQPEQRRRIGAAGRQRCLQSKYCYEAHVEAVLDELMKPKRATTIVCS